MQIRCAKLSGDRNVKRGNLHYLQVRTTLISDNRKKAEAMTDTLEQDRAMGHKRMAERLCRSAVKTIKEAKAQHDRRAAAILKARED